MSEHISNYAQPVSKSCAVLKKVTYVLHHCTSKFVKFSVGFDCGGKRLNQ